MTRHSRGCRNCVRRHILCDGLEPACKNCQVRALVCDGPHEGLHFNHTTGHPNSTTRKQSINPRSTNQDRERSPVLKPRKFFPLTSWGVLTGQSDFDRNFCFLIATAGREDQVWLNHCMRVPCKHPISSLAIEALSTAKFGKVRKDQRLLVVAAQKYAKALVSLHDALNDVRCYHFDSLAAVTAMNRYELLICTTKRGWVQHAGGVGKMIETMGPSLFNQYPYSAILESNRYRIMHEAYFQRKPTFLRQQRWRAIRNPVSDMDMCFNKLQDLYGVLSEVAAQVTFVNQQDGKNIKQRRDVSNLINDLIQDLDDWSENWKTMRNFIPFKTDNDARDSFHSDSQGLVFTDSLSYPTIEDAIGMNMCLSIKLTGLEWQRKLQQPSWWAGPTNQNMVDIPEARSIVKDICRGLHLHFNATGVISNAHYLIFTAVSAHKGFHRHSREMRWLQALLTRTANLTGVELARCWINCYGNRLTP